MNKLVEVSGSRVKTLFTTSLALLVIQYFYLILSLPISKHATLALKLQPRGKPSAILVMAVFGALILKLYLNDLCFSGHWDTDMASI